ncbi:hypothetical protein H9641_04835 [Oerskovia sp. Sa2CUA9]|uniref:Tyr recombinase domain-containing protein n=1 Tax=Oerskovia merdavium TaxID=2762227 RepID=A0ABR8TW73_9CELL|nr:hypothetical protein [Oerskovia merdavium]
MLTVTAWEKRVAAHPDAGHLSRGQRQRLALKLHKRALRAEDVDLNKVLQHSDVTGEEAVGLYVRQPALDRDRQPYAHLRL